MDAFIKSFSELSSEIMPILGATALVCVIILLIKLIKVLGSVDATLLKTHNTIDLVDTSISKVQAPLDTAVKLSNGVDRAYDTTVKAVDSAKEFVVKNAENIKDKVVSVINGEKADDEEREPNPEDIIGG